MGYWIAGAIVLVAIIIFALIKLDAKHRNQELDRWGETIPISDEQQAVMTKLWEASQIGKPPSQDIFNSLSNDDQAYLLKICSADFRPARFGDANVLRVATFIGLTKDGFSPEQASIIIGMIFNSVGKKDIDSKYDRTKRRPKGRSFTNALILA
jgi:hypothetical protein